MIKKVLASSKSIRLVLVSGGGLRARRYIEEAKKLGADQATMDEIGIEVSRINAMVLISALGNVAYPIVPETLADVVRAVEVGSAPERRRVVVLGGLHPGQSTNAVAALVAEKLRAERLYNATDVDAVYTEDPRKSSRAKRLSKVTTKELSSILGGESLAAGGYDLMDPIALKLIERSSIPTTILECDPKTLAGAILKRAKYGTEVVTHT